MAAVVIISTHTRLCIRYFGKEAAQIIIKLAAGNGFKKVFVGQDAIMATPAMSAFIRRRKLYGERGGARGAKREREGGGQRGGEKEGKGREQATPSSSAAS